MDPHVEFDYRGRHVTLLYSMDVLYGFKTVYPELAVRVLG